MLEHRSYHLAARGTRGKPDDFTPRPRVSIRDRAPVSDGRLGLTGDGVRDILELCIYK